MDSDMTELLSGKLMYMIADFNAIGRHKMYDFK